MFAQSRAAVAMSPSSTNGIAPRSWMSCSATASCEAGEKSVSRSAAL
jgi:hypothetical protein